MNLCGEIGVEETHHYWIIENHNRNVCYNCGLVDQNPIRTTTVRNDVNDYYRLVRRDDTKYLYIKFPCLAVENNMDLYTNFCKYIGKQRLSTKNKCKFDKFLQAVFSQGLKK